VLSAHRQPGDESANHCKSSDGGAYNTLRASAGDAESGPTGYRTLSTASASFNPAGGSSDGGYSALTGQASTAAYDTVEREPYDTVEQDAIYSIPTEDGGVAQIYARGGARHQAVELTEHRAAFESAQCYDAVRVDRYDGVVLNNAESRSARGDLVHDGLDEAAGYLTVVGSSDQPDRRDAGQEVGRERQGFGLGGGAADESCTDEPCLAADAALRDYDATAAAGHVSVDQPTDLARDTAAAGEPGSVQERQLSRRGPVKTVKTVKLDGSNASAKEV